MQKNQEEVALRVPSKTARRLVLETCLLSAHADFSADVREKILNKLSWELQGLLPCSLDAAVSFVVRGMRQPEADIEAVLQKAVVAIRGISEVDHLTMDDVGGLGDVKVSPFARNPAPREKLQYRLM
jgi:hypothetical protein